MSEKKDVTNSMSLNELLSDLNDEKKYNFSIDDIIAEYGSGSKSAPSAEQEPAEQEPAEKEIVEEKSAEAKASEAKSSEDEQSAEDASDGEAAETAEAELENEDGQRIIAAAIDGGKPEENPPGEAKEPDIEPDEEAIVLEIIEETFDKVVEGGENEKRESRHKDSIHIVEEVEEPSEKKGFFHRRKKEEPREKKKIIKQTNEEGKLFKDSVSEYFGPDVQLGGAQAESEKLDDIVIAELNAEKQRKRTKKRDIDVDIDEKETAAAPDEAAAALVKSIGRARLRMFIGGLFCLLLAYMTFAVRLKLPIPQTLTYLHSPFRYLMLSCFAQVLVMLLCNETIAIGVRDLLTFRPNLESSVAFASFASLLHCVGIIFKPEWEGYLPYTFITSLSLLFAARYLNKLKLAKLRTYRTVSAMSHPYLVSLEDGVYENYGVYIKHRAESAEYIVNQTEQSDIMRKVWAFVSPITIVASIAMAVLASVGNGAPQRFLFCLSAISAMTSPFSLLMPYCQSFFKTAKRLGVQGEAVTGWRAASEFSVSNELILTDNDIFPPGSIIINGFKITGGHSVDKVISYSASLIAQSGAGIAKPFLDLLSDQDSSLMDVKNFKHYENGGVGGDLGGNHVLAGSGSFMMRTGIKIPRDVNIKSTVFVAINQELAGVFAVNYTATAAVKNALAVMSRHNITPIFAVRDFNITLSMIETKFKISTDTADYPAIGERLALSDTAREIHSKPIAAIGREGLGHYVECVVLARNLKRAAKSGMFITLFSVVVGMLIMFLLTWIHAPVAANPANMFLYMAVWFALAKVAAVLCGA